VTLPWSLGITETTGTTVGIRVSTGALTSGLTKLPLAAKTGAAVVVVVAAAVVWSTGVGSVVSEQLQPMIICKISCCLLITWFIRLVIVSVTCSMMPGNKFYTITDFEVL